MGGSRGSLGPLSRTWLAAGLLVLAARGSAVRAVEPDPFAACEEKVRTAPEDGPSYLCFYDVARSGGRSAEADARLARAGIDPAGRAWATFARGTVALIDDEERALDLYRRAAGEFARLGIAGGEVRARYNLRNILEGRGEQAAASAEAARALRAAEATDDRDTLTLALFLEAEQLMDSGGDLGRAGRDLRRAEALVFPDGAVQRKRQCLNLLGGWSFRLGRYEEAIASYRRLRGLERTAENQSGQATALVSWAHARQRELEEAPEPGGLAEVETLAREALALARAAGRREMEQRSLQLLGEIERSRGHAGEARRLLERSLALARELENPERISNTLWSIADLEEGQAAARAAREAIASALKLEDPRSLAYTWQGRIRLAWRTRPRAEALDTAFLGLEAIEALRTRQQEEEGRVGLFSAWTQIYRWLAGRLLDAPTPDAPRAFAVMERMRGRFLLESLAPSVAAKALPPDHPAWERERQALEGLAEIQRRLLDPELTTEARPALLAELARRELVLDESRAALFGAGSPRVTGASEFVSLDRVRGALGPREALLQFQLGSWRNVYGDFAGGSWLLAVTRGGVRVHRLPDRSEIEPLLPLFLGLLERRDGSEGDAARRLGGILLGPALAALPAGVDRLVLVPDGALYNLPFDVLRIGPEGEPIGLRYELALAPSATLFARWRTLRPPRADRSALVLADPALPSSSGEKRWGRNGGSSPFRAAVFEQGMPLAPLPYARREGRAIARLLGARSELLVGEEASERRLANPDVARYAILHFAAHALADGAHPSRSAVFLAAAPDAAGDSLLQPREIVLLPLAGRLVVLSACRTASGTLVSGEGPLSLARAFFQAGATAVLGSRWPLADDEAARLAESFYRHLARGAGAAAALRAARREAKEEGLPAAAWAGLVLIGEPEWRLPASLRPDPRANWSVWAWWGAGGGLALLALLLALARRRPLRAPRQARARS